MLERSRSRGRGQPTRLLLAAVLGAALVGAVTGSAVDVDGTSALRSEPAGELPLVTPPPGPTPLADRSPAPRSDRDTTKGEAVGTTGGAVMPASPPVRVRIPAIGVDSELLDLGLQSDGTLEVPPTGFPAGWYTGAPTPGELGPAIITGHVDWGGRPGVFFDLRELARGDDIAITRQDGSTAQFRVTRVEQFNKQSFPTQAVYGDLDHAGLRLITCAGSFDALARSYDDNLVVFAELVGSNAGVVDPASDHR